jgi:dipeptidyl aminopeptidase/acylaminoacyl peptidase
MLALAVPTLAMAAEPANKEAALFGAREEVQQISLSPDGQRIAVIAPVPGGAASTVLVGRTDGGSLRPVLRTSGSPDKLRYCVWPTATRIICGIDIAQNLGDGLVGFSRLVSLNADGSDLKQLSARASSRALGVSQSGGSLIDWQGDPSGGSVLMTRIHVPEETVGTLLAKTKSGLGVDRIDAGSHRRQVVEPPAATAVEYITDGQGTVRIRGLRPFTGTDRRVDAVTYQYRLPGERDWRELGKMAVRPSGGYAGFNPYAVDPDLNVAYGFDDQNGRKALFKTSLDGSLKRELVFAHPEVDVDDLVRIGRRNRVVGVGFATDKRRTEFFDPELKALRNSLAKALPDRSLISFVDASADESRLLLWAGSDRDPGRYYLYHKAKRELNELVHTRPQLNGLALATVKPVSFPAADGANIPGYLTLPAGRDARGLPAIVLPHGGPGARDEWGFDWLAQYFAARGFAVLQPNFRGSTGYGDAWFQKNGFQSWRTAIGDVNEGGRWLVKQGIADPAKLGIVGWSYGGYAALQSAALDPALFKAIVAIAPVTDLAALREEFRNFSNYPQVDRFIGQGPHLRDGSPARNAAGIRAPVLLFHGDRDQNVGVAESRLMRDRLREAGKSVEYVEFPGLDHQLDDQAARTRMLAKADEFLRTSLKL